MKKLAHPLYTEEGVVFFEGPWAKALYLADGSVQLLASYDQNDTTTLNPRDGFSFKQAIGDKRVRPE